MIPLDARKKFQLHWRPIFSLMEGAPDLEILPVMDTDSISLSFSAGKQYLRARVSYVFENERSTPDQWGIPTWSKKVARSSIMKLGNDSDKANLPVATHRNQPRQQRNPHSRAIGADLRRTRRRVEIPTAVEEQPAAAAADDGDRGHQQDDSDEQDEPRPMQRADDKEPAAAAAAATNDNDGALPAGNGLLPLVNLTATAAARGEEIAREVREEMGVELREQRQVTNAGRPDGHGGVLFVGPRF